MKIKNIILPLILLFFIRCHKEKKEKRLNFKNKIILIFGHRTYKNDTLIVNNKRAYKIEPSISYTKELDFSETFLSPKNYLKNDTVIINTRRNIILHHQYHYYYNSIYIFKPGDTVLFNYINDAPHCIIKNRESKNLNSETLFNLQNKVLESDMEFLIKNNRFRNKREKKDYTFLLLKNNNKKMEFIDSAKLEKKTIYYIKKNIELEKRNLFFKKEKLNNDSLLVLKNYRKLLNSFVINHYKIKSLKTPSGRKTDSKSAFDSIIESPLFTRFEKKYLLFYHLKGIINNFSSNDITTYYSKFKQEVKDTFLLKKITDQYLLNFLKLKRERNFVYLTNLEKEKHTLKKVLNKHNGKVVYIDFWASWCAPCRAEMPSSKKIQKDYKDKNIVFIYISTDKDFQEWEKASKEEGLLFNENNFLCINYPKANFYKELQLKTIPRYLLYNKKGELIHTNAPRPSSKELRKLIDKLLKEQVIR